MGLESTIFPNLNKFCNKGLAIGFIVGQIFITKSLTNLGNLTYEAKINKDFNVFNQSNVIDLITIFKELLNFFHNK